MVKSFEDIKVRAVKRKGGEEALKVLLPTGDILTPKKIAKIPDDRFLSAMTKGVFQAGFNWKVIENKWDGFEEALWGFNVKRCAFMSPDDQDALMQDTKVVRNAQKISTVPLNAQMILEVQKEHGSFASFIARWPNDDCIGLLEYLKKHGARLGGATAQYFLRRMGYDGFVLGRDGTAALINAGVIDKAPTSKKALRAVQEAYNQWHKESGYGYAEISRVLALSIDT
ncbi:MAG: DNA-3-methyladenine glycosylase I [Agarilytica sp.]